jgi:uncharacterized membrane protein YdjX (TVP38/TMEM64 family)
MKRRLIILLAIGLTAGVLSWLFQQRLPLAFWITQELRLRQWVTDFPTQSLVIGFVVFVAASLVPGTVGKSVVYGWLFGFWTALLIVNVGLTLGALIVFLAIRYAFGEAVHRRFRTLIERVDEALLRDGPLYLVGLRLMYAPYTLTNYVAGGTAVSTRTFWWTTQLGILPGNIVFVLAGTQLPSLRQLVRDGVWSLIDLPLLVALSLCVLIPVSLRWCLRKRDSHSWIAK